MPLAIRRKCGESVQIGNNIIVRVERTTHNSCRLIIDAPSEINIVRSELVEDVPVNGSSQEGDRMDCEGHDAPFFDHEPLLVGGKYSL